MLRMSGGVREADRGVALAGPAAMSWLTDRGFVPEYGGSEIRVAGDALRTEEFALLRIWHNASRVDRSPAGGGQVIGFVLEGEIHLEENERITRIGTSEGYSYESSRSVREDTNGSTALLEAHLSPDARRRLGIPESEGLIRIESGLTSSRVFVAAVSAMLSASLTTTDLHFFDLRMSVEFALKGVFAEAGIMGDPGTRSRSARLRRRASAIIERRHGDPTFGVAVLAEEADTSRSVLHAAFAEAGTTPFGEIRRARVVAATELLQESELTVNEMSRAAGFPSVQAMNRALQRYRRAIDQEGREADDGE